MRRTNMLKTVEYTVNNIWKDYYITISDNNSSNVILNIFESDTQEIVTDLSVRYSEDIGEFIRNIQKQINENYYWGSAERRYIKKIDKIDFNKDKIDFEKCNKELRFYKESYDIFTIAELYIEKQVA